MWACVYLDRAVCVPSLTEAGVAVCAHLHGLPHLGAVGSLVPFTADLTGNTLVLTGPPGLPGTLSLLSRLALEQSQELPAWSPVSLPAS